MTEEDVEIDLRRCGLKKRIDVTVANIEKLIDDCIISSLLSYTEKSQPFTAGAEVWTVIDKVID